MSFRPDEAAEIGRRMERARPDLMSGDWVTRMAEVERALAVTAWRSLPVSIRVQAMLDWLSILQPQVFPIVVREAKKR